MSESQAPVVLTRRQEVWKFFQFLCFSASAAVIETALFTFLKEVVHASYWPSYLPAIVASVLWNFTVNRKFTFKSVNDIRLAMIKVAGYNAVFIAVSTLGGDALSKMKVGIDKSLWEFIIFFGTLVVNFITEFCVYRFWVYGKSINTSEAGKREQERVSQKAGKGS